MSNKRFYAATKVAEATDPQSGKFSVSETPPFKDLEPEEGYWVEFKDGWSMLITQAAIDEELANEQAYYADQQHDRIRDEGF